jgi:hypothetical protein
LRSPIVKNTAKTRHILFGKENIVVVPSEFWQEFISGYAASPRFFRLRFFRLKPKAAIGALGWRDMNIEVRQCVQTIPNLGQRVGPSNLPTH